MKYKNKYHIVGEASTVENYPKWLGRFDETTWAVSEAEAIKNIKHHLRVGNANFQIPNWVPLDLNIYKIEIIDTKYPVHVKYEPENTCPECGRELTDFGYCPYCDFLDEDIE